MKKNITLSLALSAILVSSTYAADHNTITFSGMVKETTCMITSSEGSADFTVKLPTYAPSQFKGVVGKIQTSEKPFSITATGLTCDSANIYLSSAVSTETGIIKATTATGDELAIIVQTDKGADVEFNSQVALAPSSTDINKANFAFNAYYRGVGAGTLPKTGTYDGIATYIVANN